MKFKSIYFFLKLSILVISYHFPARWNHSTFVCVLWNVDCSDSTSLQLKSPCHQCFPCFCPHSMHFFFWYWVPQSKITHWIPASPWAAFDFFLAFDFAAFFLAGRWGKLSAVLCPMVSLFFVLTPEFLIYNWPLLLVYILGCFSCHYLLYSLLNFLILNIAVSEKF